MMILHSFKEFLMEMKTTVDGKTSTDGEVKHYHEYTIDEFGNGKTLSTSDGEDHVHNIQDKEVLGSGKGDHTHSLKG